MTESSKESLSTHTHAHTGSTCWKSPSNIALVKYWGKRPPQLPQNPSLSFTLDHSYTQTQISWSPRDSAPSWIDFSFEGQANKTFSLRVEKFVRRIAQDYPILDELQLSIDSKNTFPHSSGIASSASAMSALALGICDLLDQLQIASTDPVLNQMNFHQRASFYSRLGSGSACRSIYPKAALWGAVSENLGSDLWAEPMETFLHPNFNHYQDAILIVDGSSKAVSSSAGHQLMENHAYRDIRFADARQNIIRLMDILKAGDYDAFITLVEAEAMQLHALMMTSDPGYILIKPNTLHIIEKVKQFRQDQQIPICYTLDAGPNVHLLYPENYKTQVHDWIADQLLPYTVEGQWIPDEMGLGSQKINPMG